LLGAADFAAFVTSLTLTIGTDTQAWDADLDTYAGITPSANVQTLLGGADFAAVTTSLGLTIGTNTQAWDADLDRFAALTGAANTIPYYTGAAAMGVITSSANVVSFLGSADTAGMVTALALTVGTNTQAWDADLDTFAGITPAVNMQTFLATADYAAMVAALTLTIGTNTQAWDTDLDTYATLVPSAMAQVALVSGNNSVVLSHRHRVTVAEINAGHEILPAITGLSYRVIDCVAIAYGGAVGTTATVDLLGTQSAGGVKIAAYAQASLIQSAVLSMAMGAGATVLADGASWVEMDAATAITVGKTGGDADTATGVDFIITYVIE